MKYSVVVPTCNRAGELRETLASLCAVRSREPWEVVVVDNNCTDGTPGVVRGAAVAFPVPLKYVFEVVPGRSAALNAGIAHATGDILVTIDDDVRVEPDYLDHVGRSFGTLQCDYIGGRVLPLWRGRRPSWLPERRTRHWAVIALVDEGQEPFEWTTMLPIGANFAMTRRAFEIVGPWNTGVGRKAGTLLGQEVREWCLRARERGLRGYYAPASVVRHVIHADRLKKSYFRRWFYWRGISRALMYQQHGLDMESPQRAAFDFARMPHVAGVPRYLYRTAASTMARVIATRVRGDETRAFEQELLLWMYAGILRQRWRDRGRPLAWASREARGTAAPGGRAHVGDAA
ncbi:MAG: glycosyltransferase family 2 protein [Vicinamibacterales bacterium]